ncbi:MAG: glycosyltransferase [Parachlamydia sp.]|nr:glycosyltransferase [Parachlamydia sp.]
MQRLRPIVLLLLFTFGIIDAAEAPPQKKRVCLNMIVKNESHVIKRCLSSVKPLIDSWIIVDTGSTDGTQGIIREFMKDVPGELFERPWVNFEHNREEALQQAKKSKVAAAEYILFMDADDYLVRDGSFKMPELIYDYYLVVTRANGSEHYLPRLIKSSLDWHWHDVLHEYIQALDARTGEKLEGIENVYTSEGARSKDPDKYKKDAKILEEALKKQPNNVRYMFYLGRSYQGAQEPQKALENYEKRVKMGGWPEEVFWSYLQIARLRDELKQDPKKVEDSYLKAFKYRPVRIEPLYHLVNRYRQEGNYQKGYDLSKVALEIKRPNDTLFLEQWIYDYGMLFEYSICAYWVGQYEESLQACNRLLAMKNLPDDFRVYVVQNRAFAEQKIQEQEIMNKMNSLFPEFAQLE